MSSEDNDFTTYDFLHAAEGLVFDFAPLPFDCFRRESSQWCEYVSSSDPHVSIVVNDANKASQLFFSSRLCYFHNCMHFLWHCGM